MMSDASHPRPFEEAGSSSGKACHVPCRFGAGCWPPWCAYGHGPRAAHLRRLAAHWSQEAERAASGSLGLGLAPGGRASSTAH